MGVCVCVCVRGCLFTPWAKAEFMANEEPDRQKYMGMEGKQKEG